MGQISEITRQTNAGTQEAAMSVSYLAELADQLRASVSTFRLPERSNEMVEVFPGMGGEVPALPGASADQFFVQDMGMGMNNEWNQGFSPDFLHFPNHQKQGIPVHFSSHSAINKILAASLLLPLYPSMPGRQPLVGSTLVRSKVSMRSNMAASRVTRVNRGSN